MSLNASFSECQKRRIAQFKNNWANLEQIDLDLEILDQRDLNTKQKSPVLQLKNSSSLLHSQLLLNSPTNLKNKNCLSNFKRSKSIHNLQIKDSYCECNFEKKKLLTCNCGELEDNQVSWIWDEKNKSAEVYIDPGGREVSFHRNYSKGTAAVRGNKYLSINKQHFWEIKLTSAVYGTDMMIGIGSDSVDLKKNENKFTSMLGKDQESWGLSYEGRFHHNGECKYITSKLMQGTIIGIHLDMWNGVLKFYKNRQPLGTEYKDDFRDKKLYAMASSTAARSGMRLLRSKSMENSLQYLCCTILRKIIPPELHVLDVIKFPPGLDNSLRKKADWILAPLVLDEFKTKKMKLLF